MDCGIKYKGKTYSYEDFTKYLYEGGLSEVMPQLDKSTLIGEMPISKLDKAESRLKNAWDAFKNSGVAADQYEEAKRQVELVRALFDYAIQKGAATAKELIDYISSQFPQAKKADIERFANHVSEVVSGEKKLTDAVVEIYKDVLDEAEISTDEYLGKIDQFTQNGVFDYKAAIAQLNSFIQEGQIDEQLGKAVSDLYKAANDEQKAKAATPKQPKGAPTTQAQTKSIGDILTKKMNNINYPSIIQEGEDGENIFKRITAQTQEEVLGRDLEVDSTYVRVSLEAIQQIAMEDAVVLRQAFGDEWIEKTLEYLDTQAPNSAKAIGILSVISTDIQMRMNNPEGGKLSPKELGRLLALQDKADQLSIEFASEASKALNVRRILRKFAQGENISDALTTKILSEDTKKLVEEVEAAMSQKVSDAELNNAPDAPVSKPKRQSIFGRKKAEPSARSKREKMNDVTRDEIINDAKAEAIRQGREKVSRADLLKSIAERIKNC